MEAFLYWAAGIVTVGGAAAMLWRMLTAGRSATRKWDMFLDDWHGTAARPGRPAIPGVMQRLVDLEASLQEIRHEVFPNSGGSLRDAVDRLERTVSGVGDTLGSIPIPRRSQEYDTASRGTA